MKTNNKEIVLTILQADLLHQHLLNGLSNMGVDAYEYSSDLQDAAFDGMCNSHYKPNNSFRTEKVNDFFALIAQLQSDTAPNEKRTDREFHNLSSQVGMRGLFHDP